MVNKSRINDPRTWKQWSESGALGTLATAHQPKQLEELWRNEKDAPLAGVLKDMVREAGLSDYLKVRPDTYLTFVTEVKKRDLDAKVFAYWTLYNVLGSGNKRVTPEYFPSSQYSRRVDNFDRLEADLHYRGREVRRSLQELITGAEEIDKRALKLETSGDTVVLSVPTTITSPEGLRTLAATVARFVRISQKQEQRVITASGYGNSLEVVPKHDEGLPVLKDSLVVVTTGLDFGTRLVGSLFAQGHPYQIKGSGKYRSIIEQLPRYLKRVKIRAYPPTDVRRNTQNRADDLGDKVKRRFEEAGYQVLDTDDFLNGVRELYLKPSVEEVITEELPRILKADPQFFLRNQINLTGVTERLHDLYANDPKLKARYEDPVGRVSHSFKVWLRHVRYFMVEHPDREDLGHTIDELKKILEGRFLEDNDDKDKGRVFYTEAIRLNSIGIPNIYDVKEEQCPLLQYSLFASYEQVQDEVRGILPFIRDSEVRKVTMTIMSASDDLAQRAITAKEIFESYLNEARSLVVNREKQIPDFYDQGTDVYKNVIERARKAILV